MKNLPIELEISNLNFPASIPFLESAASYLGVMPTVSSGVALKRETGFTDEQTKELCSLAVAAWRIKARITDASTKETKEELSHDDARKIARYLQTLTEALGQLGLETIDRTGEPYDYGLPERVIAATPMIGVTKEIVRETLRPTIICKNQIFPGEIEIFRPETTVE